MSYSHWEGSRVIEKIYNVIIVNEYKIILKVTRSHCDGIQVNVNSQSHCLGPTESLWGNIKTLRRLHSHCKDYTNSLWGHTSHGEGHKESGEYYTASLCGHVESLWNSQRIIGEVIQSLWSHTVIVRTQEVIVREYKVIIKINKVIVEMHKVLGRIAQRRCQGHTEIV